MNNLVKRSEATLQAWLFRRIAMLAIVAGLLVTGCADTERIDREFAALCEQHAGIKILQQTDESIEQYRDESGEIDWHALSEDIEVVEEGRSQYSIEGARVPRVNYLWKFKGTPMIEHVGLSLWVDGTLNSQPRGSCPEISVNEIRLMMFKE